MTAIDGAAVLVTGAANGIGKALATTLARRGCDVALADRDEAGIRALAQQLQVSGARGKITHTRVDIGNPSDIEAMAATVLSAIPVSTSSSTTPAWHCSASFMKPARQIWTG